MREGKFRVADLFTADAVDQSPVALNHSATTIAPSYHGSWLALTLDCLPLEATRPSETEPLAVVDTTQRNPCLIAVNDAARACGLAPGWLQSAALAVAPRLQIEPRRPSAERVLLDRLADWAGRFTSTVSQVGEDALLLDVAGSLRLFGGCGGLMEAVTRQYPLHFTPGCTIAPTPKGALWLSRHKAGRIVALDALRSAIAELPLAVTRWPEKRLSMLRQMGIRKVGGCWRLPRAGFARRFGAATLLDLDRALGLAPDPQIAFVSQQRFSSRIDFDEPTYDRSHLIWTGERLLEELIQALRQRESGVDELKFLFWHNAEESTPLELSFASRCHELTRFLLLFEDRLEYCQLPKPVSAISLVTSYLQRQVRRSMALPLEPDKSPVMAVEHVVERLRGRLGPESVFGLCLVDRHSPELAWAKTFALNGSTMTADVAAKSRPLWMLEKPLPLVVGEKGPRYQGDLVLISGPERIETGWWDGRDIARDYFWAKSPAGPMLWVYRDRRGGRNWYLHGFRD